MDFQGAPYPIVPNPKGFLHSQKGVAQVKSDLLVLLLTNPGERCLTGDTLISLRNGDIVPIKYLVDKDPFFVNSYDSEYDRIIDGTATAYKTVSNAELVEITLDNDEKIRCTPNHRFLLKNKNYKEASELSSENSLMSLHQIKSVKKLTYREDCYDLHVEKYHNFALNCGVFVHNCMLPNFGTPLKTLVFEQNDTAIIAKANAMITNAIKTWEPRINIQSLQIYAPTQPGDFNQDSNSIAAGNILGIKIVFFDPENIQDLQSLTLEIPLAG